MDLVTFRSVLDRKEGFLRRNLLITPAFLYRLQENGIITETTRQIMTGQSSMVQQDILLEILRKSDYLTFQRFLAVLRETHNKLCADALLDIPFTESLYRNRYLDTDPYTYKYRPTYDRIPHPPPPRVLSAGLPPKVCWTDTSPVLYTPTPTRTTLPYVSSATLPAPLIPTRYDTDKAMVALKTEEYAIKDLLAQNNREQYCVRESERALIDLDYKMRDLQLRARELEVRPAVQAENARTRISRLNHVNDRYYLL